MSRRDGACWRHPAYRSAGVCPECLSERLNAVAPSPDLYVPRRFSNGAELGYVLADHTRTNLASCTGEFHNPLVSPLISDAYLRRSKSWSHWEGIGSNNNNPGKNQGSSSINQVSKNGFYAGRKSDAVLDDWTRQRFFSIFAKDQYQQSKRNEAASSKTPQRFGGGFGYELHKSQSGNERRWQGSTPSSASRLESSKLRERNTCTTSTNTTTTGTILENGGLEEGVDTDAAGAKKSPRKSSAWWSSLLQRAFRRAKWRGGGGGGGGDESESESRRTWSSGYFNKAGSRKEDGRTSLKKSKSRSIPTSEYRKSQTENKENNSVVSNRNNNNNNNLSWIASPMRLFKQPKQRKGVGDHQHQQQQLQQQQQQTTTTPPQQQQQQRHSCCEERSPWSIPSTAEVKRHHPTTPAYTAYYRDYGAWSLSSSPVPNNRWSNSNRGKQPWENRDVAHSSSSPYHGVGTSTWNFYLTPVRPVKATSSGTKHRY